MMPAMTVPTSGAPRLAWFVERRRVNRKLSKVGAAKLAGVSRQAWTDLEAGIRDSYDTTYQGVEEALRWERGSCAATRDGGEPTELPEDERVFTRAERAVIAVEFMRTDPVFAREPSLARALIELSERAVKEARAAERAGEG